MRRRVKLKHVVKHKRKSCRAKPKRKPVTAPVLPALPVNGFALIHKADRSISKADRSISLASVRSNQSMVETLAKIFDASGYRVWAVREVEVETNARRVK